jgi:hypothetical protein
VFTAIRHHVNEQNPQQTSMIPASGLFAQDIVYSDKFLGGDAAAEKRFYSQKTARFFGEQESYRTMATLVGAVYDYQYDYHRHAREFFASFVDESFRKEAPFINAVHEYNEYFSNSQSAEERARWIAWGQACVDVWRDEYRTQPDYAHIGLILGETAVGNDLPAAYAKLSHQYPWVHLGYHPYVPVYMKTIRPDAWPWYSGRWSYMDDEFRAQGFTNVTWFFGEFGAVGHNGPGWPNSLAPLDGWRHSNVYDGDVPAYLQMMGDWMARVGQTRAWKENRVIGATIFTSGGGSLWRHFEVRQPEMSAIAQYVNDNVPPRGQTPPPPPPPPPPEPECKGLPRVQYHRTSWVLPQDITRDRALDIMGLAYDKRISIIYSYDDAGVGALDENTAVLWGIADKDHRLYSDWYATHYPGTEVLFQALPQITLDVPLKSWVVTQRFGDNYDKYMEKWGIPGHNGIDFGVDVGTPVYAARGGTVRLIANDPDGYGKYVRLAHEDGVETYYGHLTDIAQLGAVVAAGDVIGWSGNTGWSTGPHLHFGVKVNGVATDPEGYTGPVSPLG